MRLPIGDFPKRGCELDLQRRSCENRLKRKQSVGFFWILRVWRLDDCKMRRRMIFCWEENAFYCRASHFKLTNDEEGCAFLFTVRFSSLRNEDI